MAADKTEVHIDFELDPEANRVEVNEAK